MLPRNLLHPRFSKALEPFGWKTLLTQTETSEQVGEKSKWRWESVIDSTANQVHHLRAILLGTQGVEGRTKQWQLVKAWILSEVRGL